MPASAYADSSLLLWPAKDGALSRFMGWVTLTHTKRGPGYRQSSGTGHVYQGRFKSFAVQQDAHLLTVCRYVERNAVRAKISRAGRTVEWRGPTVSLRSDGSTECRACGPVWRVAALGDEVESAEQVAAIQKSVLKGATL